MVKHLKLWHVLLVLALGLPLLAWFSDPATYEHVYIAFVNDVDVRPSAPGTAPEASVFSGGGLAALASVPQEALANVWSDGTFVYISSIDGVSSYSVNEAGSWSLLDTDATPTSGLDVWGDGTFVYVVDGANGLLSYSVDGAGQLTLLDTDYQAGTPPYTAWYTSVWGDDSFVYVAAVNGGLLSYSVDGSGQLTYRDVETGADCADLWADGALGGGRYVYVTTAWGKLQAYGVTELGALSFVAEHLDTGNNRIWGSGDWLYVTSDYNGVRVYNSSSGTLAKYGYGEAGEATEAVWGDGTFLYATSYARGLSKYERDESTLTLIESDLQETDPPYYYWQVCGSGATVYVTTSDAGTGAVAWSYGSSGLLSRVSGPLTVRVVATAHMNALRQAYLQYREADGVDWHSVPIQWDTSGSPPAGFTSAEEIGFDLSQAAFGLATIGWTHYAKGDPFRIRLYVADDVYENADVADDTSEDGTNGWQDQWVVSGVLHDTNSKPSVPVIDWTPKPAPDQP